MNEIEYDVLNTELKQSIEIIDELYRERYNIAVSIRKETIRKDKILERLHKHEESK